METKLMLVAAMLVIAVHARAQNVSTPATTPQSTTDSCLQGAARYHGVNPLILRAIIFHESRDDPNLVMKNKNGSIDVGLGGLNSVHFPELARYGIGKDQLLDGCVNVYVSAWHLAKQVKIHGNTWTAVGTYHSKTPSKRDRYATLIFEVLKSWRAIPPSYGSGGFIGE
jgi:soluble lytic murein transglycosylase-like protein